MSLRTNIAVSTYQVQVTSLHNCRGRRCFLSFVSGRRLIYDNVLGLGYTVLNFLILNCIHLHTAKPTLQICNQVSEVNHVCCNFLILFHGVKFLQTYITLQIVCLIFRFFFIQMFLNKEVGKSKQYLQ